MNREYKRADGKNAKKYERTITTTKVCPICGEQFEARVWNRKTCYKKECEIANALQVYKTRKERDSIGQSNVCYDREFECQRCHKTFIKHTTKRKQYFYCDDCVNIIKEETYIYNKIQKTGTAADLVGRGNNQWR